MPFNFSILDKSLNTQTMRLQNVLYCFNYYYLLKKGIFFKVVLSLGIQKDELFMENNALVEHYL